MIWKRKLQQFFLGSYRRVRRCDELFGASIRKFARYAIQSKCRRQIWPAWNRFAREGDN